MKKIFILTAFALGAAFGAFAQGVHFEESDWNSVLAKARAEQKLVYVDVYTTWCGPCKILEKQIFPQKAAGDKYNALFVNYRIDAEKGEGIAIAKKYKVDGYPTHLFIEPVSETVVYRDMGASAEVADFNHHADVALQEKADPMTWDKYMAAFSKGRRDTTFLRAHLNKAKLLDKPNDELLDAFVATLGKKPLSPEDLEFLAANIKTLDNKAVALVAKNKRYWIDKGQPDYFRNLAERWAYGTFDKAVQQEKASLLDLIDRDAPKYTGKKDEALHYWYRTQYYTRIGDSKGALKAGMEEAAFLTGRDEAYFTREDAAGLEDAKKAIRAQLKMMNVPEDKLDEQVEANIKRQPSMSRSVSSQTANKLNGIAWDIYEKHRKDPALVQKALGWSKRSLELAEGLDEWPMFADTYAHLLYVAGKREEAILLQERVVAMTKEANGDFASMEADLQKMKEGAL